MQLLAFLEREGLTLEQFAARIGRSAATVSRIARGMNPPDWATMHAIERETAGAVTPNDFRKTDQPVACPEPAERAAS